MITLTDTASETPCTAELICPFCDHKGAVRLSLTAVVEWVGTRRSMHCTECRKSFTVFLTAEPLVWKEITRAYRKRSAVQPAN